MHTEGHNQAEDKPSRRIPKDAVRLRMNPAETYRKTQSGQGRTQPTHTKGRSQAKDEPSRHIPKDTIRPRTNPADAYQRTQSSQLIPRTNPSNHTSLSIYVRGTFNSGFPKLRYRVKSLFFGSRHSSGQPMHSWMHGHSSDDLI